MTSLQRTGAHALHGRRARRRRGRVLSEGGSRPLVLLLQAGVVVLCLVLWQVLSGPVLPNYAVSNPKDIADSLGSLLGSSAGWSDIRTTAVEILLGFLVGVAIGTVGAIVLGSIRLAGQVLEPLVAALNGIPKVALAPLFLIFFGIGETSKIAIAATMVAFVVFYNVYYGMRTVRTELAQLVTLMGGRHIDTLRYVTLPSLVTPFFAGLKAGGPLAIIGVVIGEFLASFNGVGHLLFVDGNDLNSAGVFSGIVILVVIALILNGLLSLLDGLVSRMLGLSVPRGGARHRTAVAVAVETAESEGVQPDAASIAGSGSTTPPDTTHANHGRTKP